MWRGINSLFSTKLPYRFRNGLVNNYDDGNDGSGVDAGSMGTNEGDNDNATDGDDGDDGNTTGPGAGQTDVGLTESEAAQLGLSEDEASSFGSVVGGIALGILSGLVDSLSLSNPATSLANFGLKMYSGQTIGQQIAGAINDAIANGATEEEAAAAGQQTAASGADELGLDTSDLGDDWGGGDGGDSTTGDTSTSSETDSVTAAYENLFGYAPDQSGLDYWNGQLADPDSGVTADTLSTAIQTAADEIWAGQEPTIVEAYESITGRTPTDDEVQYWLNEINNPSNSTTMDNFSSVFQTSVNEYYVDGGENPITEPTTVTIPETSDEAGIPDTVIPGLQAYVDSSQEITDDYQATASQLWEDYITFEEEYFSGIDAINSELDGTKDQIGGITDQYSDLSAQYAGLSDQYSGFQDQYTDLFSKYGSYEDKYSDLSAQYGAFDSQFSALSDQYGAVSDQYNSDLAAIPQLSFQMPASMGGASFDMAPQVHSAMYGDQAGVRSDLIDSQGTMLNNQVGLVDRQGTVLDSQVGLINQQGNVLDSQVNVVGQQGNMIDGQMNAAGQQLNSIDSIIDIINNQGNNLNNVYDASNTTLGNLSGLNQNQYGVSMTNANNALLPTLTALELYKMERAAELGISSINATADANEPSAWQTWAPVVAAGLSTNDDGDSFLGDVTDYIKGLF